MSFKKIWIGMLALAMVAGFASLDASAAKAKKDKEETKKAEAVNEKCPFAGKKANTSKTMTVEVGLCCNRCKSKFEDDLAANLAKVKDLEKCPFSGKAVKAKSEVTVAFCCGKCLAKGKKNPVAVLAKVKVAEKKDDKKDGEKDKS